VIEPSLLVVAAVLVIVVEDDELLDDADELLLAAPVFSVVGVVTGLPMELIDMSLLPFRFKNSNT